MLRLGSYRTLHRLSEVAVRRCALGCRWPNPLLTAEVLTTASIPFFCITDRGYVRVKTGEAVGLFMEGGD